MNASDSYFSHESAIVDPGASIGAGTKIWHYSHIMPGARVGRFANIGQNVFVGHAVVIGNHVKIQNNVSLYEGVQLHDYVFCGPSAVFTNILTPRSEIDRRGAYLPTRVERGASIGANATIVCGATIGCYALVGAGAVIRGDVQPYALMLGVPAKQQAWVSRHGHRLKERDANGYWRCPESKWRYLEQSLGRADGLSHLTCVDWPEDKPLSG